MSKAAEQAPIDLMVSQIVELVRAESPSIDLDALDICARVISDQAKSMLGVNAEILRVDGRPHVRIGTTEPRIMMLGHFDTVWPIGTLQNVPCVHADGVLTGPGCFDMKAGIVLALHALAMLDDRDQVTLLLTSDEEIGSQTSRDLLVDMASGAEAVLVLEPSAPGGALKTGRKGVASYRVHLDGRAAHAGLEPHKGVNAVVAAAHEILGALDLGGSDGGTTVTPTIVEGGTAINVVPDHAVVEIDVRGETVAELERVDRTLRKRSAPEATGRRLEQLSWRPPLEPEMSAALYERALAVARAQELESPPAVSVGGGSDGNYTAAAGTPTLDGLGAIGDGAHAPDERVETEALADRLALLVGLITSLLDEPLR